jgi:regulator of RNase E activity RraA
VVGHAITISYLPERSVMHGPDRYPRPSRLAHRHLFSTASPGDVAVFDARGEAGISVMGGLAAGEAVAAGVSAVIVDGAVRDLSEIGAVNLSVWSRGITPITGKWRLEAVAVNGTISCAGVQVQPGDLVVADDSGVCFVPYAIIDEVLAIMREIVAHETSGQSLKRETNKLPDPHL